MWTLLQKRSQWSVQKNLELQDNSFHPTMDFIRNDEKS
jgi:hypothetical protein